MTDDKDTRSLYVKIRQWFQPYYRPTGVKNATTKPARKRTKMENRNTQTKKKPAKRKATQLQVMDYRNPLDNAINFSSKPSPNRVWCYHDNRRHQIFAHLMPQSGFEHRERDNAQRRKLEPMLYPTDVGVYDRTHLLPIGYHGSERDRRLLVGWDSNANRGIFEAFESKYKRAKNAVYWFTSIERTKDGAKWTYRVYDVDTLEMIDELHHTMTAQFVWQG